MTTRKLTGPVQGRPKKRHPKAVESGRAHSWGDLGSGQPAWLNNNGKTEKHCSVCGVTELGSFVMADHAGSQSPLYTYRDVKGNQMTSLIPLGCPTFMVDHKGFTMENRERVRQVDDRVDGVGYRVSDVEARMERLEAENAELKAQVGSNVADIGAVVDWLSEMVALHQQSQLETVEVQVAGRVAALPAPVADMILNLGAVTEREKVPAYRQDPEIEDAEYIEIDAKG